MSAGLFIQFFIHKHRHLLFVIVVFFSIFIGAAASMGNDVSTNVNNEQLEYSLETESKDAFEEGEEAASYEDGKNNEEGSPEEVDDSEEYSDYPKNFIIPRGTCDPRPPAMIFSE
jgi:hypothetical protein